MSAPKATEAAVAAVQKALGCIRETWPNDTSPAWCDTHWEEGDDTGSQWTERGCPVAVAAADAAAPHIAAQEDPKIEGRIIGAAAKHREDTKRGGCTCGFCAWSPEHVAVMAYRDATGRP